MTLVLENAGIPVLALEIENRKQAGFYNFSRLLERPIIGVNTFEQSFRGNASAWLTSSAT